MQDRSGALVNIFPTNNAWEADQIALSLTLDRIGNAPNKPSGIDIYLD